MQNLFIDTKLMEAMGVPLPTGKGVEQRYCCPFCLDRVGSEDSKYHFYINTQTWKGFCHRCEFSAGSREYLLRRLKIQADYVPDISRWDEVVDRFKRGSSRLVEKVEEDLTPVTINDYNPMLKGTQAHAYCLSRGISDEEIYKYHIGFGSHTCNKDVRHDGAECDRLKGRIIFPDYIEGRLDYWTARIYEEDNRPWIPKYRNPPAPKRAVIYSLERVKEKEEVVITEGNISCIHAGEDAVGTYSKTFTEAQVNKILRLPAKRFIIAYDGDALKSSINLAFHLHAAGRETRIVLFPDKDDDPACIGGEQDPIRNRAKFAELRKEAVLYHPIEILKALLSRSAING